MVQQVVVAMSEADITSPLIQLLSRCNNLPKSNPILALNLLSTLCQACDGSVQLLNNADLIQILTKTLDLQTDPSGKIAVAASSVLMIASEGNEELIKVVSSTLSLYIFAIKFFAIRYT